MNLHTDIEHLPSFRNAVITIGTFDGVHLGHQKIIAQLKSEAEKINGETVIITFHPHPRKVVNSGKEIKLITTIEERIDLLAAAGIDHLVIVEFTHGFSELEPREYVELFLNERFHPAVVIIGYDHKFGRERKGDYKLLEEYSEKGFFTLREIPQHLINDSTVNSTMIRNSILDGKIAEANRLLGHVFNLEGEVIKGDQRGRTIGFPTANLRVTNNDKIIPGNGVYAVTASISVPGTLSEYKGMMNIGVRPTVDGTKRTIEVNIFDFDADIYGKMVRIYVRDFIRPEKKFGGIDELKQQIQKDKQSALAIFEHPTQKK